MDEFPFPIRKIIHVDMDAFYASVEQLDNPEYRGKPIAVGGSKERGVVAAASYEARKYGVRSAMASVIAARRCPDLIFVKPRFERYKEISNRIRDVFFEFTDLVEPLSLDEAFLDVTKNKYDHQSATILAEAIRFRIKEETGLNASAGVSVNKFVAKIASDINKPNGQKTIPPQDVLDFLSQLRIEKFFGVGKVTADKMKLHGIFNGSDLRRKSKSYLDQYFGKSGRHFYDIVRGTQNSEVKSDRIRKSIAAERTFSKDISTEISALELLKKIAEELERRTEKSGVKGKTITLKLKYNDFTVQTRSRTVTEFISASKDVLPIIQELLHQEELKMPVRLLGISLSKLNTLEKEEDDVSVQLEMQF